MNPALNSLENPGLRTILTAICRLYPVSFIFRSSPPRFSPISGARLFQALTSLRIAAIVFVSIANAYRVEEIDRYQNLK